MQEYRYDMHVHTSETSACGWMPAAFIADLYKKAGYAGFCVSDHLHEKYFSSLPCRDDWAKCVEMFLSGYRAAKKRGDEIGLDVIMAAEVRFPENDSDYLIYGIDENFLLKNPYLHRLGHQAFFDRFKDEILIVHAHPFRNGNETVYDDCVHGIEIINGNHRHKNYNDKAFALTCEKPRLLRCTGSDTHRPGDEAQCALAFERRITDSFEFKAAVERKQYKLCAEFDHDILDAANAAL